MAKYITSRVICPQCSELVGVVGVGDYRRHPIPGTSDTCPMSGLPVPDGYTSFSRMTEED